MLDVNQDKYDAVLINQPAGLGDIIFVQAIAKNYIRQGKQVIFPVSSIYFEAVKRHLPMEGVTYVQLESNFLLKEHFNSRAPLLAGRILYLPLTWSHLYFQRAPVGVSKYLLAGMPMIDWRSDVSLKRDISREARLISDFEIGSNDFRLINRYFGTPPNVATASFEIKSDYNGVDVHINPLRTFGFQTTPFDYIGLILGASEIHMVESVMCYLVDLCRPSSVGKLHCYDRHIKGEESKFHYPHSYIHRHPDWIFYF